MNSLKKLFSGINLLMLFSITAFIIGCDDDNPGPGDEGEPNVRIISVNHTTNTYILKNFGDGLAIDDLLMRC